MPRLSNRCRTLLPNRLMDVAESGTSFQRSDISRADYEDWKRLNHSFSSLDVYTGGGFLLQYALRLRARTLSSR